MPKLLGSNQLARSALVVALLLSFCSVFIPMTSQPALAASSVRSVAADTGDNYPWSGAQNVGFSEWGYSTCPANDTNCKVPPLTQVYNGVTYGLADPWGYAFRNCTSWSAWAVHDRDGVDVPHGLGNADTWASHAKADGIGVDATPTAGAVAQWNDANWNFSFGHVAWVETVNSSTSITIEEYNGQVDSHGNPSGVWSPQTLTKGSSNPMPWPDNFIHFGTYQPPPQDPVPPPIGWNFENLEGGANAVSPYVGNVGKTPSSVVFNGQIYVFYYTVTGYNLRVAYTTPGWVFDTVDGLGGGSGKISADVGQVPDAVVFNNTLYVFYYDKTNGNLRMAWSSDGRTWQALTMDGDPGSLSGYNANVGQTPYAVVYSGSLQLFYYQPDIGVLRHAWSGDGTHWNFETLDGTSGSNSHFVGNVGLDVSATVYSGTLQLFYSNIGQGDLRHAWSDANGWHFENLDGDAGSIGHSNHNVGGDPSAYVYNGSLGVLYYDSTQGSLRHAWSDVNGWHFEVLMGGSGSILGGVTPVGSSITTMVNGSSLQAFVYQAQFGDLDHVWNDGNGWHEENLDGAGGSPAGRINANVGLDPTEIMNGTSVVVFYYDADNGALRHAWSN